MSGSEHARPIWAPREFRDYIANLYSDVLDSRDWVGAEMLGAFVEAWDAAPADPTEAIHKAIYGLHPGETKHDAVLRALGSPE